jgi:hypothetical protein
MMGSIEVLESATVQPDISYAPDHDKYLARTRHRLRTEQLPGTVPEGFPKKLVSDFVWEGNDLVGKYDWVYELSQAEVREIEDALKHFKSILVLQKIAS